MKTILQLTTSLFGEHGQSTRLVHQFIQTWRANRPEDRVLHRDLGQDPIPHLTAERIQAFATPPEQRTAEQAAAAGLSDQLIDELKQADVIVLGLPMYNFGVPSTLKAYIDHVARAGVTFRYTENGPVGLLDDKTVHVLATRGGAYEGTPMDTQSRYIKDVFGFLGLTDVRFIYAEGLNMGEERQQAALAEAGAQIALQAA